MHRRQAREQAGLADPLPADTESALRTALGHVARGDGTAASSVLDRAFPTPCEESAPDLRDRGTGHPVACHRVDGEE